MKYIYLIITLFFLGSCGTNSSETTIDSLLGSWEYENPNMPVKQVITYKEDGTYQMRMASMDITGTWELTDDVLITKSSAEAKGQKKTIIKITQDSLCTFWEPADGGEGRPMNYVRKLD